MILPLLLAAITCTPNADGTWTCSGDTIDDFPSIVEQEGNYVCTNCVAISSNECERIKNSVIDKCYSVSNNCQEAEDQLKGLRDSVYNLITVLSSFEPCPYSPVYTTTKLKQQYGLDSSSSNANIDQHIKNVVIPQWQATPNRAFTQLDPEYRTVSSSQVNYFYKFHAELCGIWSCSYAVATQMVNELNVYNNTISYSEALVSLSRSEAHQLEALAKEVTCAQCVLGSSSGDGGGSGSETGCLECYLSQLRQINSNLGRILDSVNTIKSNLSTIGGTVTNQIYTLIRLQDNFYNQFNRTDNEDTQKRYGSIVSEDRAVFGQGFNESAFNDLPWFKRVELLLYKVANPTNAPVEEIDDDSVQSSLEDTGDELSESIENFVNGSQTLASSLQSIRDVVTSLQSALAHSAPLTDGVTLMEGGTWISDEPLVLRINITIQNALHAFFSCLWLVSVSVVVWRVSVAAWSRVVALVRWLLSLIDL